MLNSDDRMSSDLLLLLKTAVDLVVVCFVGKLAFGKDDDDKKEEVEKEQDF